MSTSSHVPAHSFFAAVSKFFASLFSAPKASAKAPAAGPDVWKLYRMSRGRDSVNPALLGGLAGS